jgi:[ribosomal protein S5]-alanine N-acetyltransferase
MLLSNVAKTMQIYLETDRLLLRRLTLADADHLYALDSDPEVMRFINGGAPTPLESIQTQILPRFLSYYEKYEQLGFWAAQDRESQQFIGWFHFYPAIENPLGRALNLVNETEVALGYRLRRSGWGKGLATEGSIALVRKGFTELGVQRVVGWALSDNIASIRVMEKAGLRFETAFAFTEAQLPTLTAAQRKAVKLGLDRSQFDQQ